MRATNFQGGGLMKRAKIFSFFLLFGLLLFSSSILAQDKGKVKSSNIKKVVIKKSKLDLIKADPNYKIVSQKKNHIIQVAVKKKHQSVIDALKEEFKK